MVAPVDIFVFFSSLESFNARRASLETRTCSGGGRVHARYEPGAIPEVVELARTEVGAFPLGMLTETETDALLALQSGVDEAAVLDWESEEALTRFLDRVLVRARSRHAAELQRHEFAQAEKLSALGTLVAGVGHELNNPLSSIILGYDILHAHALPDLDAIWAARKSFQERGVISPEEIEALLAAVRTRRMDVRDMLDDMQEAGSAVSQLVQDLRVFSRSDAVERPSLFSLHQVIEQALRLVRREFGTNTVIEEDYADDLPQVFLQKNRLSQVITNILVNAAHAIESIERDVHRVRVGARVDEDTVAITIQDTGPGISEEHLERVFDPFFTTKREGSGTGLGLSISRQIVQDMGGDLNVTSVYGQGATFLCFLPLPTEDQKAAAGVERPSSSSFRASTIRGSVLLVDDDELVLRMASRSLRQHFKVLIARDGKEATELLASGSHADVIVTELDLPELDGPGLLDWLRKNLPEVASRVVIATAAQERAKYRKFLETHTGPVLHKPLSTDALTEAVSKLID